MLARNIPASAERRYGFFPAGRGVVRSPAGRGAGCDTGVARHSIATILLLLAGSVVSAVTAGSHVGGSLNRVRSSSEESFCTSMNSPVLIETANARTVPLSDRCQRE